MPSESVETVTVGWIRRPHGVAGLVEVAATSDVAGRFAPGSRLLARLRDGSVEDVAVLESRAHGKHLLVRLDIAEDRDRAARLRGASLEVTIDQVPSAPPGTYYFHELIGCRCRDHLLGDLGTVIDVQEDGGGLLLEVEARGGNLLVPFVDAYLPVIDVSRRWIEMRLPPGLVEACRSR